MNIFFSVCRRESVSCCRENIEIGQLLLKVNKRSVASGQVRLEAEMKLSANDASAAIVLTRWRELLMSGCR